MGIGQLSFTVCALSTWKPAYAGSVCRLTDSHYMTEILLNTANNQNEQISLNILMPNYCFTNIYLYMSDLFNLLQINTLGTMKKSRL